jgi:hypothetical protein
MRRHGVCPIPIRCADAACLPSKRIGQSSRPAGSSTSKIRGFFFCCWVYDLVLHRHISTSHLPPTASTLTSRPCNHRMFPFTGLFLLYATFCSFRTRLSVAQVVSRSREFRGRCVLLKISSLFYVLVGLEPTGTFRKGHGVRGFQIAVRSVGWRWGQRISSLPGPQVWRLRHIVELILGHPFSREGIYLREFFMETVCSPFNDDRRLVLEVEVPN